METLIYYHDWTNAATRKVFTALMRDSKSMYLIDDFIYNTWTDFADEIETERVFQIVAENLLSDEVKAQLGDDLDTVDWLDIALLWKSVYPDIP